MEAKQIEFKVLPAPEIYAVAMTLNKLIKDVENLIKEFEDVALKVQILEDQG